MTPLDERSKELRRQIVRMLAAGGQGHPGPAFSLVEIMRVLYDDVLKYDAHNPQWPGRDRLILSKGHGYLSLYVMLADKGFIPETELWRFCKPGGLLGVHPSHTIPGVEVSTGSLGHGLSMGCGMAKTGARVFVVMGDGECNEGAVWEAALYAAKHKLQNLTALIDYNGMQASGKAVDVQSMGKFTAKWRAFGWSADDVDGHDCAGLRRALELKTVDAMPRVLICHTVKGCGVSFCKNNPAWHHKSKITPEEVGAMLAELDKQNAG